MRLIIVGAGSSTRELMLRLGEIWELTLVDTSSARLERARHVRNCRTVAGDGSSLVVLRRAGVDEADALLAATDDDDVNLEACRLARESGILRILGLVNDPDRVSEFRALEVRTVGTASLIARQAELGLESRRISSKAFADGKAEAIEVRVAHDSPVRGRSLMDIRSENWIVGAVLRHGRMIVPHGDTSLEEGDLVTVIGPSSGFGQIIRSFTSGEARFPLQYGKRVALVVDEESDLGSVVSEAEYLARNSRAGSLLLVHRDPEFVREPEVGDRIRDLLARADVVSEGVDVRLRAVRGSPGRALARIPQEESVGVVVLPAPAGTGRLRAWRRCRQALSLVRERRVPVLLSRRTHPYAHILLPARRTPVGESAARVAIDLARLTGSRMTGLAAIDPVFSARGLEEGQAREWIGWLTEEAAAQGVTVNGAVRTGNPVQTFLDEGARKDLLVLGVGKPPTRFLRVDVIAHLLRRSRCSVMLVPSRD